MCGLKANRYVLFYALLAVLLGPRAGATAQSKTEIRESMKERYAELQKRKTRGSVGETYRGYVESVTAQAAKDQEIQELIKAENADRRALYDIIAMDTGTTAEAVGRINAQRVFDDAGPGIYFKTKEGTWKQKKDISELEQ
ncbi:MAG: DUF1318 domain-containing protein [Chitinivibrionales bacterium]|nr:DUF1318 domain-containing protein [Chitinivibrionales bacterium]MBD3355683.1 DUF1318 domain-containing protein [Chitinivibrionales bacterium]